MPLTKGHEAKIDAGDVHLVEGWNWHAHVRPHAVYAKRVANGRSIYLHRVIMDALDDLQVDHINGDGLDNRCGNLRLATRFQNTCNQRRSKANTSGFKGVSWHESRKKWRAQIYLHGRKHYLGLFEKPESAHAAYCAASAELHGEFGRAA